MYYGILVHDPFLLCPLPVYLWSKLIGAANQEVARDSSKTSAFVPQQHKVRMRSDKRNKGIQRSAHSRGDGSLVKGLQLEKVGVYK